MAVGELNRLILVSFFYSLWSKEGGGVNIGLFFLFEGFFQGAPLTRRGVFGGTGWGLGGKPGKRPAKAGRAETESRKRKGGQKAGGGRAATAHERGGGGGGGSVGFGGGYW